MPPSVYSISRNATVVSTALISRFYLKNRLSNQQVFAIALIVFGFFLVSFSDIFFGSETNSAKFSLLSCVGIIFLILGLFFQGFSYCYEEKMLNDYIISVPQLIGFESMIGMIFCTVIFLVFVKIPCRYENFCIVQGDRPLDSPVFGFMDLFVNRAWIFYVLLWFSIMIFNRVGMYITKYSGAVLRVVLDTFRTTAIWIISLATGLEKFTSVHRFVLELVGFLCLILGNLMFNKIINLNIFEDENQLLKDTSNSSTIQLTNSFDSDKSGKHFE